LRLRENLDRGAVRLLTPAGGHASGDARLGGDRAGELRRRRRVALDAGTARLARALHPVPKPGGADHPGHRFNRGRPQNGWQAVFMQHSVQAILLSGDDNGPVFVRAYWPTAGIANPSGACMVESEIWAVLGDGYLARSSGHQDPDTGFADPVRPDVKN